MTDSAARIAELRRLIEEANYCYHVLDDPSIPDADNAKVARVEAAGRFSTAQPVNPRLFAICQNSCRRTLLPASPEKPRVSRFALYPGYGTH